MHTVLLVDDEKCVLDSLYRSLKNEPYEIICAQEPEEALDILQEQEVSLILSDIKMPKMNGIELLKKAAEYSPDSVKMLLSGYSEVDLIVDAINSASVWRYIAKPWNNEDLIMAIKNGIQYYELQQDRRGLLDTLERKNAELEELNSNLEEMVKSRTERINAHVNLLMQLLNGVDIDGFTVAITTEICSLMKADGVSIELKDSDDSFPICKNSNCGDFVDCREMVNKVISSKLMVQNDGVCVVPIINSGEVYAILIVKGCKEQCAQKKDDLESLLVIYKVALQREVMKNKASSILGDIDNLLNGC